MRQKVSCNFCASRTRSWRHHSCKGLFTFHITREYANIRAPQSDLTNGVCGTYYTFPGRPALRLKRSVEVLTSHHSHTSSAPPVKFFGHTVRADASMDHSRAPRPCVAPLPRDWNRRSGTTASHLAPDRRIRFSTTQQWSGNRLSSSTESSSLENARRNGNV